MTLEFREQASFVLDFLPGSEKKARDVTVQQLYLGQLGNQFRQKAVYVNVMFRSVAMKEGQYDGVVLGCVEH